MNPRRRRLPSLRVSFYLFPPLCGGLFFSRTLPEFHPDSGGPLPLPFLFHAKLFLFFPRGLSLIISLYPSQISRDSLSFNNLLLFPFPFFFLPPPKILGEAISPFRTVFGVFWLVDNFSASRAFGKWPFSLSPLSPPRHKVFRKQDIRLPLFFNNMFPSSFSVREWCLLYSLPSASDSPPPSPSFPSPS